MVAVLAFSQTAGGVLQRAMASPSTRVEPTRDSRISRLLRALYRQFTDRPARLTSTPGTVEFSCPVAECAPVPLYLNWLRGCSRRSGQDHDIVVPSDKCVSEDSTNEAAASRNDDAIFHPSSSSKAVSLESSGRNGLCVRSDQTNTSLSLGKYRARQADRTPRTGSSHFSQSSLDLI